MSEENQSYQLGVQGMTCVNCAKGIEKKLLSLGASSATVNFADHQVSLEATPSQIEELMQGIRDLGYIVSEHGTPVYTPWWSTMEFKVGFAAFFTAPLLAHMVLPFHVLHNPHVQFFLALPVILLGLVHFGRSAIGSLRAGVPNMDVLIIIGVIASFVYSCIGLALDRAAEFLFFETAASIVMYVLIGNLIEERSVKKTTSAIEDLSALQPAKARLVLPGIGADKIQEVDAATIHADDVVLVTTGDKIPADGVIISGDGLIDESMLTGESLEVEKAEGERVFGGTIIAKGSMKIRTSAVGKDTVLAGIIKLVAEAQANKPKIQRIGDAVSAVFVPFVMGVAILTFIVSFWLIGISAQESMIRAIAVLVVACPCAMGLATPTAVMVGVGRAAKLGILIRGGDTLERFAKIGSVLFDKTGTITTGRFTVERFDVFSDTKETLKGVIYSLEERSSHPIAVSLREEFKDASPMPLSEIEETKGLSIHGKDAHGNQYALGSKKSLKSPRNDDYDLYLSKNGEVVAALSIQDEIKKEAPTVVAELKSERIYTAMLSGDNERKCKRIQDQLQFHEYMSERTPDEKLDDITRMESMAPTAYVGDGINDAPALTRAFVGVSLSQASASAIKASRVVLLNGNLQKLIEGWRLSKLTLRTIKQNLFWAFFYNILMIPLAACGYLSPGIAALSMAFSDVFVIGNSLRLRTLKLK